MSVKREREDSDTLEILLKKANAINIVNGESLEHINAQRGQRVIVGYKYFYTSKSKPFDHITDESLENKNFNSDKKGEIVMSKEIQKKDVDGIIKRWKYTGHPLLKGKTPFDKISDSAIKKFDDLCRLQAKFDSKIQTCSQMLADTTKSRAAASNILWNVETLQVAIGEVHGQIIDKRDLIVQDNEVSSKVKSCMSDLKEIVGRGVKVQVELQDHEIVHHGDNGTMQEFGDLSNFYLYSSIKMNESLNCSKTKIRLLKGFSMDNKQYMISAIKGNKGFQIWDIKDGNHMAIQSGHTGLITTLNLFTKDGVPMLATGSSNCTIQIWNLSKKKLVRTIDHHTLYEPPVLLSLDTFKSGEKMYLVSGGGKFGGVKVWDLDELGKGPDYFIQDLEARIHVNCIKTFEKNGKPFLILCANDGVSIWCLTTKERVTVLKEGGNYLFGVDVITVKNRILLAYGECGNRREPTGYQLWVWDLSTFARIYVPFFCGLCHALKWIRSNGKACLLTLLDGGMLEVWDAQTEKRRKLIHLGRKPKSLAIVEKDANLSIVAADDKGEIQFWTEKINSSSKIM